ncbi:MAG: hypothetical protein ACRDVM_01880 [Acidimicrobiia bacterium]
MIAAAHSWWGWVAVGGLGVVGLWGIGLAIAKRQPPRAFRSVTGVAIAAMLAQVLMGLYLYVAEEARPGTQHVFYGVVVLFTLAFSYVYRAQLGKRPALRYGLLLLFLMGLGVRGILTFGHDF